MRLHNTPLTTLFATMLATLLPASVGWATEKPAAIPRVLSLAPADALAVFYIAKPADVFEQAVPVVTEATQSRVVAGLLEASGATFGGPTMVAVCGSPLNPTSIRIEFATQPKGGADAFFEQLNETWFPVLRKVTGDQAVGMTPFGALWTIRLPVPIPITVYVAQKRGLIYGSSRYNDVVIWLGDRDLSSRFVAGEDAQKLSADSLASASAFAYVNVRALKRVASMEMERFMPGLFAVLGFDQLEFAALTLKRLRRNIVVEATLGLVDDADETGVAWDLLAPRNGPVAIVSLVPADYTFFVRGALVSAADGVDRINDILGVIDPDIVNEFQEECDEFRTEYGFDPLDDFLANMVDEWLVAVRLDAGGNHTFLVAVRLADPSSFWAHVGALVRGFSLDVETSSSLNISVSSSPVTSGVRIAWAVLGDYLVLSDHPEPIIEVAEIEAEQQRSLLASRVLSDVMRQLPKKSAGFSYVNLAALSRLVISEFRHGPETADIAGGLKKLSQTDAGIGLAVRRDEGVLTFHIAASKSVTGEVGGLALKSVMLATVRACEASKRIVSATNLQGITTACLIYANDHKGAWPVLLGELIESGDVFPSAFRSPFDTSSEEITAENVDRVSSYLYRNGTGLAPSDVVLCERKLRNGGANFAFVDGHAEWITGAEAEAKLALIKNAARR